MFVDPMGITDNLKSFDGCGTCRPAFLPTTALMITHDRHTRQTTTPTRGSGHWGSRLRNDDTPTMTTWVDTAQAARGDEGRVRASSTMTPSAPTAPAER